MLIKALLFCMFARYCRDISKVYQHFQNKVHFTSCEKKILSKSCPNMIRIDQIQAKSADSGLRFANPRCGDNPLEHCRLRYTTTLQPMVQTNCAMKSERSTVRSSRTRCNSKVTVLTPSPLACSETNGLTRVSHHGHSSGSRHQNTTVHILAPYTSNQGGNFLAVTFVFCPLSAGTNQGKNFSAVTSVHCPLSAGRWVRGGFVQSLEINIAVCRTSVLQSLWRRAAYFQGQEQEQGRLFFQLGTSDHVGYPSRPIE